jgi:4-hydroxy-2-oxoheptanedioate aldolase
MGLLGQADHPTVKAAVLAALTQIRAAGKIAGVLATDLDFAADCRAAGANFIGVGIDVLLYAKAMRDLAAKVKSGAH